MKVPPLRTQNAESYSQHAEKNGVIVAVHPVTDKAEAKEIFKVDLPAKGLLPILLVAENHTSSASFVLAKDKVHVMDEATGRAYLSQQGQITSETAGNAVAMTGAAITSLPMLAAGLKMISDATVIQYNLGDKELYSHTLGPGQKAQGFIYFRHPLGVASVGAYHVIVELRDSATGTVIPFDFPVTLTFPQP